MKNIHILIASIGRPSLNELLKQLKTTILKGDKVTIVMDNVDIPEYANNYPDFVFIKETEVSGYWGHPIRTKYQNTLEGDYILNMDDDDLYTDSWRIALHEILKRDGFPEIMSFGTYFISDKNTIMQFPNNSNGGYPPYTGNTIVKNKEEYNIIPWENVMGGDMDRYYEIIKKSGEHKFSDFVLIKKN